MNIYVYWNRNDNDCTKIFHFMSQNDEHSVVELLEQDNNLSIKRIYQPFKDKNEIFKEIQHNELIIFLTHGTEKQILKYQNSPERNIEEYVLIDQKNASLLKDKVVLAFCCASAKTLGRYCVSSQIGCKAYVGFERDIVYDNGKAEKTRHIIYESYKIAFMKGLKYAVKTKCSIQEYQMKLVQYLRSEAVKAIMKSENHSLHNMYSGTVEGLVALGDIKQSLFR